MINRRAALGLGASFMIGDGARAQAEAFPDHAVRYIVPFTPAGLTDIMARLVGQKLAEIWGRPVVVENRPGGNALIGAETAARAAPDGHTLLAITLTHAVNVSLFPQAGYSLVRDFRPLSLLGSLPLAVVVNPASPIRTLPELVAQARARPMNAGSSGNGSPPHLALELLRRVTGAGALLQHVPYRGGAPGVTDLVAGNLDLMISNLPECIGQIRADRLRALAVTSPGRSAHLPGVPTVRELGLPELEITNWTAVLTNAAVPPAVFGKLERDTQAAINDPDVKRRVVEGGFDLVGWDADRSRTYIEREVERWSRLVAEAGIRAD